MKCEKSWVWVSVKGVNRNPKFRNSEIVRIPIRYSDGQQLILSDNFGQTQLPSNLFLRKTGKFHANEKHLSCQDSIYEAHTKMGQRLGETHDFPLPSTALIFYFWFTNRL